MEIQQSPLYADYIRALGWNVATINGQYIYFKRFPILGGLAKLQRLTQLPSVSQMALFIKRNRIRTIAVEPDVNVTQEELTSWCQTLRPIVKFSRSPFIPTKTIFIDLATPEEIIFRRFTEAKRRAVRRALKNNLIVEESNDIQTFIRLKNKSAGFLGFITTSGIDKLWQTFAPTHATILLAQTSSISRFLPFPRKRESIVFFNKWIPGPSDQVRGRNDKKIVGGVLLLFWDKVAYYWIATAMREGKKLFAPTLLVWEALKLTKRKRCTAFDFVGIWDERMPKQNRQWHGFTKFKEGFGGKEVYYPLIG